MKILGLDLSLRSSGYYVLDMDKNGVISKDNGVISVAIKGTDRLIYIINKIWDIIILEEIEVIFIEDYSYGSKNSRYTFSAGELGGAIKVFLYKAKKKIYIVPIGVWKKYVCGKGNLKKDQIMLQVYKKYGKEFNNNNICDAFCIAKFGKAYLNYKREHGDFNKGQIEIFKKYDKFLEGLK